MGLFTTRVGNMPRLNWFGRMMSKRPIVSVAALNVPGLAQAGLAVHTLQIHGADAFSSWNGSYTMATASLVLTGTMALFARRAASNVANVKANAQVPNRPQVGMDPAELQRIIDEKVNEAVTPVREELRVAQVALAAKQVEVENLEARLAASNVTPPVVDLAKVTSDVRYSKIDVKAAVLDFKKYLEETPVATLKAKDSVVAMRGFWQAVGLKKMLDIVESSSLQSIDDNGFSNEVLRRIADALSEILADASADQATKDKAKQAHDAIFTF